MSSEKYKAHNRQFPVGCPGKSLQRLCSTALPICLPAFPCPPSPCCILRAYQSTTRPRTIGMIQLGSAVDMLSGWKYVYSLVVAQVWNPGSSKLISKRSGQFSDTCCYPYRRTHMPMSLTMGPRSPPKMPVCDFETLTMLSSFRVSQSP